MWDHYHLVLLTSFYDSHVIFTAIIFNLIKFGAKDREYSQARSGEQEAEIARIFVILRCPTNGRASEDASCRQFVSFEARFRERLRMTYKF